MAENVGDLACDGDGVMIRHYNSSMFIHEEEEWT